jgi:hypothetical protein
MKPAKCPFYPDSCTVEFHPNMQHVWRNDLKRYSDDPDRAALASAFSHLYSCGRVEAMDELIGALEAEVEKPITNVPLPLQTNKSNGPKITNKASDRARAWNKANRETYNARQKKIMAGRRAKRGT